jgi:hypothetical protein
MPTPISAFERYYHRKITLLDIISAGWAKAYASRFWLF